MTIKLYSIQLFLLFFISISIGYAQDTTANSQSIFFTAQKQKGIYRSFTEFRNNAPSIPYQASIVERTEILSLFEDAHVA